MFRGAELKGAVFVRAFLVGADFTGAKLDGADFRGADLRRASFEDASLDCVHWTGAIHDETTIWPNGERPLLLTDE